MKPLIKLGTKIYFCCVHMSFATKLRLFFTSIRTPKAKVNLKLPDLVPALRNNAIVHDTPDRTPAFPLFFAPRCTRKTSNDWHFTVCFCRINLNKISAFFHNKRPSYRAGSWKNTRLIIYFCSLNWRSRIHIIKIYARWKWALKIKLAKPQYP